MEQIWRCTGSVLRSERGSQLKDVCLSMALSKMLNRRFTDSPLAEAGLEKTHDFVFQGLLAGDGPHERAFRVIEVELAFVHDLYYTRYPYLYHMGQYLALSLPVAMIILCSWLACLLYRNFQKHSPDSIYAGTTMVLMFAVAFLEGFQMYLYMASGWFKVALIRSYVTRPVLQREGCSLFQVIIIRLLLSFKAVRPWEEKLGQYSLLHALHSSGRITNCFRCLTLFLLDKVDKGRKRGKPVKQSAQVKQAVIDSLLESDGHLTKGVRSLQNNGVHGQLSWACDEGTVTRTILVWHVATDLCKHQLDAQAKEKKRKRLSEEEEEDSTAVDAAASVASDLSRHCAYLVAFEPGLLPDHRSVSASALDGAIDEARKLLRGARKMSRKCEQLMGIVDAGNGVGGGDDGEVPVVVLGARLARQLNEDVRDPAVRWKVLADFWAEMMLYVAPSDDARAHLAALAGGGEFVTHLWALLTHAGVLKRGTPRPSSSGSLAAV